MLLAFAIQNDMIIHQKYVVTAFLNGELQEKIYMHQPAGYEAPGNEELVCKLKKTPVWTQAITQLLEQVFSRFHAQHWFPAE